MADSSVKTCLSRMREGFVCALFTACAGVAHAAETAPEAKDVPALGVEPFAAVSVGKLFLGLIIVVLLMVAMAWMMRRMGGLSNAASGSLRVLGGLSMGTRERVVLIQVGETQLLLGVAPGRVQTLHILEHPISINETGKGERGNFASVLGAALQRGKQS